MTLIGHLPCPLQNLVLHHQAKIESQKDKLQGTLETIDPRLELRGGPKSRRSQVEVEHRVQGAEAFAELTNRIPAGQSGLSGAEESKEQKGGRREESDRGN